MPKKYRLHYGTDSWIFSDMEAVTKEIDDAIATDGGWVTLTTNDDRKVTLLIALGVPVWVEAISEGPTEASGR